MRNMHGARIQSKARQLIEVDRQIRENTRDLVALVQAGSDRGQIRVMADFVRTLFGRRETIIYEMAKLGISEADVYRSMRQPAELTEAARREDARCTG